MKYGRVELAKFFGLAGFEELVQVLREFIFRNYTILCLMKHLLPL